MDNKTVLGMVVLSIVWLVFASLIKISVMDVFGIFELFIFSIMIYPPFLILVFTGIKCDFKEKLRPMKTTMYWGIGLAALFMVWVLMSIMFGGKQEGGSLLSMAASHPLWTIPTQTLPTQSFTTVNGQVVKFGEPFVLFLGFSSTFGVSAEKLYNLGHNMFLVSVGEEMTFRGLIPFAFGKGNAWNIALLSNAGWAVAHTIANVIYSGPMGMIYVLAAYAGGFVLLWVMVQTVDITTAMLIHGAYNCIIVLIT